MTIPKSPQPFKMSLQPEKILWNRPGEGIAASGHVPVDAEFFQDHFPDFPVLPGVLSLDILKNTAESYLGKKCSVIKADQVKFSSYLKPGDGWESELKLVAQNGADSQWNAKLTHQNKTAASAKFFLREI